MMIIVMFVIFAIIVIVALSIINIRFTSQNAEMKKTEEKNGQMRGAAEKQVIPPHQPAPEADPDSHVRMEKEISEAHSVTPSRMEVVRSASDPAPVEEIPSATRSAQRKADLQASHQTRSKKHTENITMDNINDQAYREALLKFKNGSNQEKQEPVKKNMNDDAFRKALLSMTKKDEDHS
jgi:hypothetical protein